MIRRYNNFSLALGTAGLILQIIGNQIAAANGEQITGITAILFFPLFLFGFAVILLHQPDNLVARYEIYTFVIGSLLLIAGFVYHAKAKGRSGLFGMFGLLFPIGLLLFVVLKDLAKND